MITERYIKMCVNNPDLQGLWEPESGDRYFSKIISRIGFVNNKSSIQFQPEYIKDSLWLPYQEQLQDMLTDPHFYELRVRFGTIPNYTVYLTVRDSYEDSLISRFEGKSFNEAWLEFIMCEKFNKKWDDKKEEWMKI